MLLVLELLKEDLLNHLKNVKLAKNTLVTIDGHTLLSYCRQVVSGMVYLSGRDLAARNILISHEGICKVRIHAASTLTSSPPFFLNYMYKIWNSN